MRATLGVKTATSGQASGEDPETDDYEADKEENAVMMSAQPRRERGTPQLLDSTSAIVLMRCQLGSSRGAPRRRSLTPVNRYSSSRNG